MLLEIIIQPGANTFIWIFVLLLATGKALAVADIFKGRRRCKCKQKD